MSVAIPSRWTQGLSIVFDRIVASGRSLARAIALPGGRAGEFQSPILPMRTNATTVARGVRSIRGPTSPVVPTRAPRPFESVVRLG